MLDLTSLAYPCFVERIEYLLGGYPGRVFTSDRLSPSSASRSLLYIQRRLGDPSGAAKGADHVPVQANAAVCMVITYSRVWINWVRLSILLVVS